MKKKIYKRAFLVFGGENFSLTKEKNRFKYIFTVIFRRIVRNPLGRHYLIQTDARTASILSIYRRIYEKQNYLFFHIIGIVFSISFMCAM